MTSPNEELNSWKYMPWKFRCTTKRGTTRSSKLVSHYMALPSFDHVRKEIYNASNNVRSAIPHPRIMGVIKECGGKMWMGERQWNRASEDFFESFRNYDEAGSPQRIQVLKYLVLANMLTGSEVNPFDSQETKP